ncbi:hypothetical protein F5Y16DRAFT_383862 [Xylariaceae sp. FL0255]|nr:hypothetical protein F5Y16DRAFT_383862 [Xylariaceae sp. FL0255]
MPPTFHLPDSSLSTSLPSFRFLELDTIVAATGIQRSGLFRRGYCRHTIPVWHTSSLRPTILRLSGKGYKGRTLAAPSRSKSVTMPSGAGKRASSSSAAAGSAKKPPPPVPRPSASIILLSPTNQVLLLHRVKTSSAFPSAHVFPGGNLSEFHDGRVPPPEDIKRHEDSLAYRLGAIRETFEESGILLARQGSREGPMLNLAMAERDKVRKAVYENETSFGKWLESVGGVPDTENLLPFTRWVTPLQPPKRFTTQMYVYMLPLSTSTSDDAVVSSAAEDEAHIPTPDGGAEVTTAHFDDVATWLERQRKGDIILFPPQCFLLQMMAPFLTGPPPPSSNCNSNFNSSSTTEYYRQQRQKLLTFLTTVPTATTTKGLSHPTSQIPWSHKVISPVTLGMRTFGSDKRAILGLDKPGLELKDTRRGGDYERVVLVAFGKGGPSDVEVRLRAEVLAEEKEAQAKKANL